MIALRRLNPFFIYLLTLILLISSIVPPLPLASVQASEQRIQHAAATQQQADLGSDIESTSNSAAIDIKTGEQPPVIFLPMIASGSSTEPTPESGSNVIGSIGNRSVALGSTFSLQLASTIAAQEDITFGVAPLPLPKNATFEPSTGRFAFRPDVEQLGTYDLTFTARYGTSTASESITLQVTAPDPSSPTSLSGRILDANAAENNQIVPLVGATVRLVGDATQQAITDAEGYFTLTGLTEGLNYVEFDGFTANPPGTYGAYRSQQTLIAHADNVIDRPIYIMAIAEEAMAQIEPGANTLLVNPSAAVTVTIEADSVMQGDSLYTGSISISEVPDEFTPGTLPDNLDPNQVFTIQPMGLTFEQPARITLPNTANLPNGSRVTLWSMDHETSEFIRAGSGRVAGDKIVTTNGGIRESSWHFSLPPSEELVLAPDNIGDHDMPNACSAPIGSDVELGDGTLQTYVSLPAYVSQGEVRATTLIYNSQRAYPHPVISFEVTLAESQGRPRHLSYGIHEFGQVKPEHETYLDTTDIYNTQDTSLRGVASVDASGFETGIYSYTLRLTKHFQSSSVASDMEEQAIIVNDRASPFGAGWNIAGMQRLYSQPDGNMLLTASDGTALTFYPTGYHVGSLNNSRASDYAFVSGDEFQNARNLAKQTFGDMVYSEFDELSASTLEGIDILILSSQKDFLNTVDEPLRPAEQTALLEHVTSGGCAMLMVDEPAGEGQEAAQGLIGVFGLGDVVMNSLDNPITFTSFVTDPDASPITSGKYGEVPNFVQNFAGSLTELGPHAIALAPNESGTALAVIEPGALGPDSGPVIIYSDTDMFTSGDTGRIFTEFEANQRLWLNSIDYCRTHTGQTPSFYQGANGDYSTIARNSDGGFTRTMKDGIRYIFNAAGLLQEMVDRNGNSTRYAYDVNGNLTSIADPVGLETRYTYTGGRITQIIDPANRTTLLTHDESGNLTKVTFPDGSEQEFGYDERHLNISETDRRGFERTHQYDGAGRLVRATLPDDVSRQVAYSQLFGAVDPAAEEGAKENPAPMTFIPYWLEADIIDGEGHRTEYDINALGLPRRITAPSNHFIRIERDSDGNPISVQHPDPRFKYLYNYDEHGNLTAFVEEELLRPTHQFSYGYENEFNQLTHIENGDGNTWRFSYDASGNLVQTTTPLSRTTELAYNDDGLPMLVTDSLGTATRFSYDNTGNVESIEIGPDDALRTTTLGYTDAGDIETLTDSLGRRFDFAYDEIGQLTQETLPGNRIVAYAYDADGNLTNITPPEQPAHRFEYDGIGMVSAYIPPTVEGSGTTQTSYSYNKVQQLTEVSRPDGKTITVAYDAAGRLSEQMLPRGAITYTYRPKDGYLHRIGSPDEVMLEYDYQGTLLTSVEYSGAIKGEVRFRYDKNYRLEYETAPGGGIQYTYDSDGNPIEIGPGFNSTNLTLDYDSVSGVLETTTIGSVQDQYAYNAFGELSGYQASYDTNALLFETSYVYDPLGRITTITETISGTTFIKVYGYDVAGRLEGVMQAGAVIATYGYDTNGNRTTGPDGKEGRYDAQDRLLRYGDVTYSYNANGDLLTRTENGDETRYNYDVMGNLLGVTLPDGKEITYIIDGQNRRVGKVINGELQQGLIYRDQLNPVAELDSEGNVVSRFVYGSRPHVPDYMVQDGEIYRFITDHLGSVRLVIHAGDGTIMQRMDYDVWGNVILDTNEGFQPFGFAGGIYDHETGLVRFGARDYDAEVGRWTTKDPIGFEGGDTNLYAYVGNAPNNYIDPEGKVVPIIYGIGIGLSYFGRLAVAGFRSCYSNSTCRSKIKTLGSYYSILLTEEKKKVVDFGQKHWNQQISPLFNNSNTGEVNQNNYLLPQNEPPRYPNRNVPKNYEGDFDITKFPCYS